MKKSELIKIIKEEVLNVISEQKKETNYKDSCRLNLEGQRSLARQLVKDLGVIDQDEAEYLFRTLGCVNFMTNIYKPIDRINKKVDKARALLNILKPGTAAGNALKALRDKNKRNLKMVNQKR